MNDTTSGLVLEHRLAPPPGASAVPAAETTPKGRPTVWSATASLLSSATQGPPLCSGATFSRAPLSSTQERLWFIEKASPGAAAYNIAFCWRIRGPLSIPALEIALNHIIQRHSVFQTAFHEENGVPMQTVIGAPPLTISTEVTPLDTFCARPFDFATPPLLRANVLMCGDEEFFFTLVIHHLVFDGWSKALFLRELNAEYAAVMRSRPSTIPAPTIRFVDYAKWQRKWLDSPLVDEHLRYWRSQLGNSLSPAAAPSPNGIELPAGARAPRDHEVEANSLFFSLPRRLFNAVERLRKAEMTTRYVVLLAAFEALLHRFTGAEDIVLGSVAANRGQPETRNVIGCFVNTLALRTHVSSSMRFRDLLLSVDATTRDAFAHQELPFERLVAELKPERRPGRTPLFQVMFALQNNGTADLDLIGTRAKPLPLQNWCPKFSLAVELTEAHGKIAARIEFDSTLMDRPTVHRLALNYAELLEAALADPGCRLKDLPILGRNERRQLRQFNETETSYPHRSVASLFSEIAAQVPGAVAISDEASCWTYAELESAAASIATALHRQGVARGTLVAIAASRRMETIAAMLGILKLGGAYVPIDPSYPAERIEFMLKDCGAGLLLAPKALLKVVPACGAQVLCIEEMIKTRPELEQLGGLDEADPSGIAYVLYTSGSTGTPKGVCVSHRGIVRLVRNTNYITLTERDVVAQASTLAFDAATFEVWGALLNGARLELIQHDIVLSPTRLAEAIERRGLSVMFLTTSVFNLVAEAAPAAFNPLRVLLFGGESADAGAVRRVLENGGPRKLMNVYGPTETTTFATFHEIQSVPPSATAIQIGLPISNTVIHLLDADENVVPIGARGEIYIGGDGVAVGYLGRPDLTSEKFMERQIGDDKARQRYYRSGDFGIRHPDGSIEFAGRADDQVKVRGYRIELHEIEAVLRQRQEVHQCCVIARQHGTAGTQLVAYIAGPTAAASMNARDYRSWLGARLPDYMVPTEFVFLPQLPLNHNGKVNRAVLPAPACAAAPRASAGPAASIPLHLQLIQIWEDLLQVKPIGITDDFFDVGGHSLLAVRLMAVIERSCGTSLPISALFSCPTIEKLTQAVLQSQHIAPGLVEIQPGGSKAPLYFLHGDMFGGGLYCRQLARQLGPQQPFISIAPITAWHCERPRHLEVEPEDCHDLRGLPSISQMASWHLAQVRQHRPHGPYKLGGFCVSAMIALEMASELQRTGEEVETLVMVDPPFPGSLWWLRRSIDARLPATLDKAAERIRKFNRGFNRVYRAREIWQQQRWSCLRSLGRRRKNSQAGCHPVSDLPADLAAGAYLWATAGFKPKEYAGRTIFLGCDSIMGSSAERIGRWRRYLKQLDVHTFDCKHLELVTTRSSDIAAVLSTD